MPPIPIDADAFRDVALPTFPVAEGVCIGMPVAGVVNHHALASDLMDRFFLTLKTARPELRRFVIVAPDHYRAGADGIVVGDVPFVSRGRIVRSDADAVASLVSGRAAAMGGREVFAREHGIAALVPSLALAFPEASVVPVLVRGDVPRPRMALFGEMLARLDDGETFVVVSSDMSHGLTETEALRNDEETAKRLAACDAAWFRSATDAFTDNGPAFVALIAMFGANGTTPSFGVVDHAVSSRYNGDRSRVTSYLTGFWSASP